MSRPATRAALVLCGGLLVGALGASASGEDWPGWRGPRGDGTIVETDVPVRWSATENVAWKVKMPFTGHSSIAVKGDRLYLLGADDPEPNPKAAGTDAKARMLVCLDRRDGSTVWAKEVFRAPLESMHKLNSRASSTPAVDDERIYVSFLNGKQMHVAAFDLQGKPAWNVEPGIFSSVHGYCSSPVLFEGLVIVNGDHDGAAYLVALDRATGKTVWKTPRENKTRSYCTPLIRDVEGRTQLMLSGSKCIASYDPRTGTRQWIVDGPTDQFVASVVYNQGILFVTGGFPDKHILGIDPRGSGNVTATHVRWRHHRNGVSYVPSPVAAGRYFYCVSDAGIGSCYDALSGEVQWQERLGPHYSGSLVSTAAHVYFQDDAGTTKVVKVGPKFEVVAENVLGEAVFSSPACSDGRFYVRGEDHVWCLGGATKTASK